MDWATKRLHMGAGLASYDVIIVGGGPAGLSAALVLDEGKPRNAAAQALHGFLSRDGIAPSELLRISHEQLEKYETIHLLTARVEDGVCLEDGFEVITGNGQRFRGRKLMLATGVVDALPSLDTGLSFTGLTVIETVASSLVSAAEQVALGGLQLSGSPRSVTVYLKLSGPL